MLKVSICLTKAFLEGKILFKRKEEKREKIIRLLTQIEVKKSRNLSQSHSKK